MDRLKQTKSREWKKINRAVIRIYLQEYKATHGCVECGESRPQCLVFHHRFPHRKKFDLSLGRDKAFASVKEEIRKCNVMCANCHLALHAIEEIEKAEKMSSAKIADLLF